MSTQEILTGSPSLSAEDRGLVAKALQELKEERSSSSSSEEPRIANLHPGATWMAPGFDDPLPDEFWFGKDA